MGYNSGNASQFFLIRLSPGKILRYIRERKYRIEKYPAFSAEDLPEKGFWDTPSVRGIQHQISIIQAIVLPAAPEEL